jgi:hypothetical protein
MDSRRVRVLVWVTRRPWAAWPDAIWVVWLAVLGLASAEIALAQDNHWVFPEETTLASSEAVEAISQGTADNLCEGISGILTGGDPGWVRVGGSSNPNVAFVEARGQMLPDFSYKTNPFVNHTDAPFTHYSHDIDVFVTLDPEYRHLLASGNFELGDPNELGELEIEWERGGVPLFAYPSPHDRGVGPVGLGLWSW